MSSTAQSPSALDAPVVITGAGPVGLVLALELSHHGVRSSLVERRAATTTFPKMDVTNARGMELLARLGVADLVRSVGVEMVFPGGSREVWKRPGQRYQLLWGERVGFARKAIAHSYPIVPLSQLGGDEIYDIVLDVEHPLAGPYRALVDRVGARRDNVLSFGLGWAKTPLPRPQDAYIRFGAPIETARLAERREDRSAFESVRDQVREAIDHGLEHLEHERTARGNPTLARRLARLITAGRQE